MGVKGNCLIRRAEFSGSAQWVRLQRARTEIPVSFLWTTSAERHLEDRCQTACKPGSVRTPTVSHGDAGRPFLWDAPRGAPRATNPDGGAGMLLRLAARPSLFGLAPGGVYPAAPVARGAVRSCRTVSPLPAGRVAALARAVCFLWHFPWGRPRRPLAGTVFPWSPDFPLPDPRGKPGDKQRPSGRLAIHHWRGIAEPVKRRVARSQ